MINNKKNTNILITYKDLSCIASDDVAPTHGHEFHVEPGMLFPRKGLYPGAILHEGTKLGSDGSPTPLRFCSGRMRRRFPSATINVTQSSGFLGSHTDPKRQTKSLIRFGLARSTPRQSLTPAPPPSKQCSTSLLTC
jgi:hypothetical protein